MVNRLRYRPAVRSHTHLRWARFRGRQGSSGEWKHVRTFSQQAIGQNRVRYYSTAKELQLENVTDHFKCEELVFPVTIPWLKFMLLKNIPLEIS